MTFPTYHWILSVQFQGGVMKTHDGTHTPENSQATRSDIFDAVVDAVKARYGGAPIVVLYFDLAPNDLSGGGR